MSSGTKTKDTKVVESAAVEFHIRVRLPNPASYHSSPSGDTEYDDAYRSAISAAKPEGFEVRWPRLNQKWPVDSEGLTWVPLTADEQTPDERSRLLQQLFDAKKQMRRLKEGIKSLA